MTLVRSLSIATMLLLAGCNANTAIAVVDLAVAESAAAAAPEVAVPTADAACGQPPMGVPIVPPGPPIAVPMMEFPPLAAQAGVPIGCAGVLYRLSPDGQVLDPQILVESPEDLGFGVAALQAWQAAHYAPHPDDQFWHYTAVTLRQPGVSPNVMTAYLRVHVFGGSHGHGGIRVRSVHLFGGGGFHR